MGCLAVILVILAFATIPLPPVAILFLLLGIAAAMRAMTGDKKDGTFAERFDREYQRSFKRMLGCYLLIAILGLIIFFLLTGFTQPISPNQG